MNLTCQNLGLILLTTLIQSGVSQDEVLYAGARDLVLGRGAPNINCELYRETGAQQWELLTQSVTNDAGGVSDLITSDEFSIGNYRIVFHTKPYWESRNLTTFYPQAEVQFEHSVPGSTFVIPLSISPYGYSVYRGSSD